MPFDPKWLPYLACPKTRQPLRYDADKEELISEVAKLAYPIHDGIPVLLIDQARPLKI